MTQFKIKNQLLMFASVLLLSMTFSACSDGYSGPLADQPVTDQGDPERTPVAKTLFEKVVENGVPEVPLRKAFAYFDANKDIIKNKNYFRKNGRPQQ